MQELMRCARYDGIADEISGIVGAGAGRQPRGQRVREQRLLGGGHVATELHRQEAGGAGAPLARGAWAACRPQHKYSVSRRR